MKKFDGTRMVGKTERDNRILCDYNTDTSRLMVDDTGNVFQGVYLFCKVVEVESGKGIDCWPWWERDYPPLYDDENYRNYDYD